MKKLGIAFGALVALLVAAMVAVPLFVNVDKYRPQITEAVNRSLNGTLELGHLKLSLWGQVRVEVDGLSLKDAHGANVVSVKNAYFHLPFLPLLTGSPVIELNMDAPVVNVVKNRAGKLNLMALVVHGGTSEAPAPSVAAVASSPRSTGTSAPTSARSSATPSASVVAVPAIAANARLGFDLHDATVDYVDETQGLTTQMKNLNFLVKNLSLNHPSEISAWSDLDTKLGKSLSVKGPARIDLELSPQVGGGKLLQFTLDGKADFDQLDISMPGTFEKKSGVPANVELALSGSLGGSSGSSVNGDSELKIEKADIRFFNAVIKSGGVLSHLQSAPTVRYTLKSNDIDLKPWTELLPMLSQYELGGKASLAADVGGESTKLSYQARISVDGLTAKAPMLKAEPRIDGEIVIATDQVQKLDLAMTAPGNELKISGKVLSFTAPQASFDVTSSGMDLDQLIDFKAVQAAKETAEKTAKKTDGAMNLVPAAYAERVEKAPADLDALLNPLRENPMLARASANVTMNIRALKAENASITGLTGKLYYKDLAAGLESFSMKLFGGSIQANLACQLRPRQPTYKFSAKVTGLDLGEAVKSQMAMFKNTATGKANFEITGQGASFNSEPAKANLKAKGSMKIANAQLSTIDVGKMAADGIMSALSKIAGKVPGLAGKSFTPPHGASKYQVISADFGISGGKFTAPNLVGKAMPRQGIDFKGSAQLGLKNQAIDAKVQVIDTYDLLGAKEFQGGILCERGKPFVLPVGVGCTLQSPCYSYQDSAAFLAKVAMNNAIGQVRSQVQSQLQDQVKKVLTGGGAPNIGNALKGLFGH